MKSGIIALFLSGLFILSTFSCKRMDELKKFRQKEAREAENIELVRQNIHFLDIEDYESMRKNSSENFKVYIGSSDTPVYLDEGIPLFKQFHLAFPDYSHAIEHIFASDDYVAVQFSFSAVHKGPFLNIPPTNKRIEYKGIQIYEIKNGRIETIYAVEDNMTLMTQLGLQLK